MKFTVSNLIVIVSEINLYCSLFYGDTLILFFVSEEGELITFIGEKMTFNRDRISKFIRGDLILIVSETNVTRALHTHRIAQFLY